MKIGTEAGNSNVRTPHGFRFAAINITNYRGDTFNIADVVQEVAINESMYASSVVAELTIVDAANFFEFHRISGNEQIEIRFVRTVPDQQAMNPDLSRDTEEFTLNLRVSNIPLFAKPQQNSQVYRLRCISEHAYSTSGRRISKRFTGMASSIIKQIGENYAGIEYSTVDPTIGNHSVLLPNIRAIDAIRWIQNIAYCRRGGPVFVFETVKGGNQIRGYSNLIDADPLPIEYKHVSFFTTTPDSSEDYFQRKSRILDISSSLGMSNYTGIQEAAYGLTAMQIDPFAKTTKTNVYKDQRESDQMVEPHKFNVPSVRYNEKNLGELSSESNILLVYNDSNNHSGRGYHHLEADYGPECVSISHNINTVSHEITLLGDIDLEPGKIITIKLPIAMDPSLQNREDIAEARYDRYMSGRYIIVSSIHRFNEKSGYRTELKIERDSTPLELN